MLRPGLRYIDSWVSEQLDTCYQLMEVDDPRLLTDWMEDWPDLVACENVGRATQRIAGAAAYSSSLTWGPQVAAFPASSTSSIAR